MSVDPPDASRQLKKRLKSRFTFLSDPKGGLLDRIGIRHRGGRNDGADIAYPTAMLVDARGIVRWIFHADTLRERARAEDIFSAIAELPAKSAGAAGATKSSSSTNAPIHYTALSQVLED